MDCDTCREALSARLDGEAEPVSPDEHLHACTACEEWYAAASTLTWVVPDDTTPTPDVTDAVLWQVQPRTGILRTTRWRPRGPH